MSSISAEYALMNCQDTACYTRIDRGMITGFTLTRTETEKRSDIETFKQEYIIPHLSRKGKERITEVLKGKELVPRFEYIEKAEAEKFTKDQKFAVPDGKKVAKIIIEGIPADYTSIEILADIDRILGFPDNNSEKPMYK